MSKESFKDDQYFMLKGMYAIKAAKEYFEMLKVTAGSDMKHILNGYVARLDFISNDTFSRCQNEVRDMFRQEVQQGDALYWEHLKNIIINIDQKGRETLEFLAEALAKGEKIEFLDTQEAK